MLRKRLIVFTTLAIALALPGVARAQGTQCPPNPPTGATIDGGLDVNGPCAIDNVTVNGGITIEEGGDLQLTNSTVNGGILTLPCAELYVNAITGVGTPTNTPSAINGGIDIIASTECTTPGASSDADIWTAQIDGGISMSGMFMPGVYPYICGNQIKGSVHIDNVTVTEAGPPPSPLEGAIGDPDAPLHPCPGNTISGSLHMTKSLMFAVESNTIGGSGLISGSTVELNGNTVNGSLLCSDGTVILPPDGTDPQGNTVHGKNTCTN